MEQVELVVLDGGDPRQNGAEIVVHGEVPAGQGVGVAGGVPVVSVSGAIPAG